MNTPFFASVVGRWVAPAVLGAASFAGTLGFSTVASAQERVVVAGPRVVVGAPVVAPRVVVREPGVVLGAPVVAPFYGGYYGGYGYGYGPGWGRDFGRRGWDRGWGGGGYGRFGGHGAPGGRGAPSGGHGGRR
jgi:hypothetical protein